MPVSLHNKNVLLPCLINDMLQLVIRHWGVRLYYCGVERDCPQADGYEPAGDWATSHDSVHDVLVNRNLMPCSCLSPFSLKKTLCPSSVVISPNFFHLISQSPRMFHLYLSILCVISWSFPAAFSVLVFHVPMMMMSLPWVCKVQGNWFQLTSEEAAWWNGHYRFGLSVVQVIFCR